MIEQINKDFTILSNSSNNVEGINSKDSSHSEECENLNNIEIENSNKIEIEDLNNFFKESSDSQNQEELYQDNCLSLTVYKDSNLPAIRNIFKTSARISLKIAFSTFMINLLRMFF